MGITISTLKAPSLCSAANTKKSVQFLRSRHFRPLMKNFFGSNFCETCSETTKQQVDHHSTDSDSLATNRPGAAREREREGERVREREWVRRRERRRERERERIDSLRCSLSFHLFPPHPSFPGLRNTLRHNAYWTLARSCIQKIWVRVCACVLESVCLLMRVRMRVCVWVRVPDRIRYVLRIGV